MMTLKDYPIDDQIGTGKDPKVGGSEPMYLWNNRMTDGEPWTRADRPVPVLILFGGFGGDGLPRPAGTPAPTNRFPEFGGPFKDPPSTEQLLAAGWGYADVLPYFRRAEGRAEGGDDYRGADGPLLVRGGGMANPLHAAFIEAGRQAGGCAPPSVAWRRRLWRAAAGRRAQPRLPGAARHRRRVGWPRTAAP